MQRAIVQRGVRQAERAAGGVGHHEAHQNLLVRDSSAQRAVGDRRAARDELPAARPELLV